MCLSNVYIHKKNDESLVIEEASELSADKSGVKVSSLFSEGKTLEGYYIKYVNLMKNYVLLAKKEM